MKPKVYPAGWRFGGRPPSPTETFVSFVSTYAEDDLGGGGGGGGEGEATNSVVDEGEVFRAGPSTTGNLKRETPREDNGGGGGGNDGDTVISQSTAAATVLRMKKEVMSEGEEAEDDARSTVSTSKKRGRKKRRREEDDDDAKSTVSSTRRRRKKGGGGGGGDIAAAGAAGWHADHGLVLTVDADGEDDPHVEWLVEKVLNKWIRGEDGLVFYRIKWLGWEGKFNSWEPLEHLTNCQDKIDEFERRVLEKERRKEAQKRKRSSGEARGGHSGGSAADKRSPTETPPPVLTPMYLDDAPTAAVSGSVAEKESQRSPPPSPGPPQEDGERMQLSRAPSPPAPASSEDPELPILDNYGDVLPPTIEIPPPPPLIPCPSKKKESLPPPPPPLTPRPPKKKENVPPPSGTPEPLAVDNVGGDDSAEVNGKDLEGMSRSSEEEDYSESEDDSGSSEEDDENEVKCGQVFYGPRFRRKWPKSLTPLAIAGSTVIGGELCHQVLIKGEEIPEGKDPHDALRYDNYFIVPSVTFRKMFPEMLIAYYERVVIMKDN